MASNFRCCCSGNLLCAWLVHSIFCLPLCCCSDRRPKKGIYCNATVSTNLFENVRNDDCPRHNCMFYSCSTPYLCCSWLEGASQPFDMQRCSKKVTTHLPIHPFEEKFFPPPDDFSFFATPFANLTLFFYLLLESCTWFCQSWIFLLISSIQRNHFFHLNSHCQFSENKLKIISHSLKNKTYLSLGLKWFLIKDAMSHCKSRRRWLVLMSKA